MRSMNAVLLDWRPKRTAHVRVATAKGKRDHNINVTLMHLLLISNINMFLRRYVAILTFACTSNWHQQFVKNKYIDMLFHIIADKRGTKTTSTALCRFTIPPSSLQQTTGGTTTFLAIVNERLTVIINSNQIMSKIQTDFRKGYSITEQIFTFKRIAELFYVKTEDCYALL